MSATYMVRARTVATAATADLAVTNLWNPHASMRLFVRQIWICATTAPAAQSGIKIRRTTVRGTAGSTVTPGAPNDLEGSVAPVSGALLDVNVFTGVPTFSTGDLGAWTLGGVVGAGLMMVFTDDGIEVPAGQGLAVVTLAAVIVPISDVTYVWHE